MRFEKVYADDNSYEVEIFDEKNRKVGNISEQISGTDNNRSRKLEFTYFGGKNNKQLDKDLKKFLVSDNELKKFAENRNERIIDFDFKDINKEMRSFMKEFNKSMYEMNKAIKTLNPFKNDIDIPFSPLPLLSFTHSKSNNDDTEEIYFTDQTKSDDEKTQLKHFLLNWIENN